MQEPKSRSRADWYRQEWAAKTGRPASEIYVPEAIREIDVEESYTFTIDDEIK